MAVEAGVLVGRPAPEAPIWPKMLQERTVTLLEHLGLVLYQSSPVTHYWPSSGVRSSSGLDTSSVLAPLDMMAAGPMVSAFTGVAT